MTTKGNKKTVPAKVEKNIDITPVQAEKEPAAAETTAKAEEKKPAAESPAVKKTAAKKSATAKKSTAAKRNTAAASSDTPAETAADKKATEEKVMIETKKKTTAKKAAAKKSEGSEIKAAKEQPVKNTTKTNAETTVTTARKPSKKQAAKAEEKPVEKQAAKAEEKPVEKQAAKAEEKPVEKQAAKAEEKPVEKQAVKAEEKPVEKQAAKAEEKPVGTPAPVVEGPRRSVAFIGSECYPFVKTGGLGDVMYALPRALVKQNCDVKVILPRYECIPQKYQEKMQYKGAFDMELCQDGRSFYVGIMEYECDGVVYDFIDNQDFFSGGKPYYSLVDDIPKFCYFGKAALAALNFLNWIPDVIHCHDWQAGLVPIYLRTFFENTPIGHAKTMITIHNLRFQGIYNIETLKYWTNLPDYVFNKDTLTQNWLDANMFKGGLAYSNMITTVSNTYAGEIQSYEYGEGLEEHLRYHSGKLRGIINGIDYDIWNPATDTSLAKQYDITNVLTNKKEDKKALQEELGLEQDDHKFVIGLISRLTNQKGLDLVNAIISQILDEHTQVVVLGTGSHEYEDAFRYYENTHKGQVASCIQYDEGRAHRIYAGADALLVPSRFEPCGLTQLTAMHYGTIPIVRETGGLKDTVEPYNQFTNWGNGFTFDRYEAGLLLDAINRAKSLYFTNRWCWDEMVQRDMDKDVSWEHAAGQYRNLYLELTN